MKKIGYVYFFVLLNACDEIKKKEDHQIIEVSKASKQITIDGKATENTWDQAKWQSLDQHWFGEPFTHEDFNGRYKLTWDETALYILLEVMDDVLYDQNKDPLKLWWNDDCVKVFLDADNSGGLHQFTHNAFAYHIALDGNVVDIATDKKPRLFNEHIVSKRITNENLSIWEIKVYIFDDTFAENDDQRPEFLEKGKKLGFALAYGDNDGSIEHENDIGSVFIPGEDKNQAWINADLFGTMVLKD